MRSGEGAAGLAELVRLGVQLEGPGLVFPQGDVEQGAGVLIRLVQQ